MTPALRRTSMRAGWALVAVVCALARPAAADSLKTGELLAELDVAVDQAGKPFKLVSLKGRWVLVTIGASWCKPCKKELPTWDRLAARYKDKITFVALNIDDDVAAGRKFHKQLKLANMTLVYMPAERSKIAERYGADTMPTSYVADRNHVVRYVKARFEERDASGEFKKLDAELARLLK